MWNEIYDSCKTVIEAVNPAVLHEGSAVDLRRESASITHGCYSVTLAGVRRVDIRVPSVIDVEMLVSVQIAYELPTSEPLVALKAYTSEIEAVLIARLNDANRSESVISWNFTGAPRPYLTHGDTFVVFDLQFTVLGRM
jgi:hypothetical protein